MDLGLAGRAYVVVGGSRGLGRAVADVLVAEGAGVLLAARDPGRLAASADDLGDAVAWTVADVRDRGAGAALVAAARDRFGRLDGAVVSHGGPPPGAAADLTDDDLDAALSLAAAGPIRLLRDLAAALRPGGALVALTSTSAVEPLPDLAGSNLSRPAVWGYAKALADEVGGRGVRINVLLPGPFATDRFEEALAARADRAGTDVEAARRDRAGRTALGRIGDPVELGRVAAFLLSPAASYVTGAAIAVDGGRIRGL